MAGVVEACRREIDQGGFTVVALVGDRLGCDWAYSIGLHRSFGHPELVLVGMDAALAGAVVENLARRVAAGERLDGAEELVLDGGLVLRVGCVDPLYRAQGDWFELGRAVMDVWGERWPASLQLVWGDPALGHPELPGDPSWQLRQPLLRSAGNGHGSPEHPAG